jgi:hypothetical protein
MENKISETEAKAFILLFMQVFRFEDSYNFLKSQKSEFIFYRQLLIYELRSFNLSLTKIGELVKKSHCTIIHSIKKHNEDKLHFDYYKEIIDKYNKNKHLQNFKNEILIKINKEVEEQK